MTQQITNIDHWIQSIKGASAPNYSENLQKALDLTAKMTNKAALELPKELDVVQVLSDLHVDEETLVAALLCPLIMQGRMQLDDLAADFSEGIRYLVKRSTDMLSLIHSPRISDKEKHSEQIELLRRMLLAATDDLRVVLICLADRLRELRAAKQLDPSVRALLAKDTMDIYAPLANRLGIGQLKWELEDWAFRYLYPEQYHKIAKLLDEKRGDREQYIAAYIDTLNELFAQNNIKAKVSGRPKHIFSIWRKMQGKNQSFDKLFDIRAVRVMVDTEMECYAVLGLIHTHWNHIPGEFDDYIATPKNNQYRSLHTAIVGPNGKIVEVQIRTYDMHNHAEFGVAAHWLYKEKSHYDPALDKKVSWLRRFLENDMLPDDGWVEDFKDETDSEKIYVFTPKGEILDLGQGSTPLDFAYHVHTEVGHRCRGAKVNGKIVPLTHKLSNGDRVEILTTKEGAPSRDWLNTDLAYLRTTKAKNKVKEWFRRQDFEKNVSAGRAMLEKELKRHNLNNVNFDRIANLYKSKIEDLMAKIGRGEVTAGQITNRLESDNRQTTIEDTVQRPRESQYGGSEISVLGVGNLMTQVAKCCKPVADDPIVGYITQGKGVTVHRKDCENVLRYQMEHPDRLIEVEWGQQQDNLYPVNIRIVAYDRQGLLRDVSTLLANDSINVIGVNTHSSQRDHIAVMEITVEISNVDQLSRIMSRLNQLPNVQEVSRAH